MLVHLKQQHLKIKTRQTILNNCEYWHQRNKMSSIKWRLWSDPVEGAGKSVAHRKQWFAWSRLAQKQKKLQWPPEFNWIHGQFIKLLWLCSLARCSSDETKLIWGRLITMGEKLVYNQIREKRDSFVQFVPPGDIRTDTLLLGVEQLKTTTTKKKK